MSRVGRDNKSYTTHITTDQLKLEVLNTHLVMILMMITKDVSVRSWSQEGRRIWSRLVTLDSNSPADVLNTHDDMILIQVILSEIIKLFWFTRKWNQYLHCCFIKGNWNKI